MKCDYCNSSTTYVKSHEHEFKVKGKEIKFISDRRFCSNCNNLVYDSVLDNKASEKAISVYNKEYGVEKERIIELRKHFGLSQDLFSKVIGCAKKTLVSYEKGTSIPNASYLIIIKSLISNPNTILTIIEANREQFTEREYKRINGKLSSVLPNNSEGISPNEDYKPSEFNGYTKLNKNKVYNMILFFAKNGVLKTKLLKEMFYADFLCYKNNCKSMTGLEYARLPYGPVPDQFENILKTGTIEKIINYDIDFQNNYESHIISDNKKFDKNIFDKDELEILNKVKTKFENFSSSDIVDYSHKENAFLNTEHLELISYDYSFDIDFD